MDISSRSFNGTRSENQVKNRWNSAYFRKFIAEEFGPDAYKNANDNSRSSSGDSVRAVHTLGKENVMHIPSKENIKTGESTSSEQMEDTAQGGDAVAIIKSGEAVSEQNKDKSLPAVTAGKRKRATTAGIHQAIPEGEEAKQTKSSNASPVQSSSDLATSAVAKKAKTDEHTTNANSNNIMQQQPQRQHPSQHYPHWSPYYFHQPIGQPMHAYHSQTYMTQNSQQQQYQHQSSRPKSVADKKKQNSTELKKEDILKQEHLAIHDQVQQVMAEAKKQSEREMQEQNETAAKEFTEWKKNWSSYQSTISTYYERKYADGWNKRLKELQRYKQDNPNNIADGGDVNKIPLDYRDPDDITLGEWARLQRDLYWEGKLDQERVGLLEEEGFDFEFDPPSYLEGVFTGNEGWDEKFAEFVSCNVFYCILWVSDSCALTSTLSLLASIDNLASLPPQNYSKDWV